MKRFTKAAIVGAMILSMGVPAFADGYLYSMYIKPPYIGSMESTSFATYSTGSPFFEPGVYTIETGYFLSPQQQSATTATDVIQTDNMVRRRFTYKAGYGGSGQAYYLSAYPIPSKFDEYNVRGTWSS